MISPGRTKFHQLLHQFFLSIIIFILLPNITSCSQELYPTSSRFPSSTSPASILRVKPRRLSSSVACSRNSLVTTVSFPRPFSGSIFAKGYGPDECTVLGNGSRIVHFKTTVNKCGIKVIKELNSYEMQLYLYIQHDQGVPKNFDERIFVRCAPQEILLSGSIGRQKSSESVSPVEPSQYSPSAPQVPAAHKSLTDDLEGSHHDPTRIVIKTMDKHEFATAAVEKTIDARMDIMKGRPPAVKPIDSFVDIGDDVTILIQIKDVDNIDSKISRCYAHDGTHSTRHSLTDDDGCTLDPVIMPNFKETRDEKRKTRVIHTTFPAFKFPDKSNLHIQCSLVICNTTCPKFECTKPPVSGHSTPHHLHPHRLAKRSPSSSFFLFPIPSSTMRSTAPTTGAAVNIVNHGLHNQPLIDPSIKSGFDQKVEQLEGSVSRRSAAVQSINRGENDLNSEVRTYLTAPSTGSTNFNFISKSDGNSVKRDEEEVVVNEEDSAFLGCLTSPTLMITLAFVFSSLLASTTLSICLSLKVRQLKKQLDSINRTAEACAARAMIMMNFEHQSSHDDDLHPLSSSIYTTKIASSCPSCCSNNRNHRKNQNMIISQDTDLQNDFSNS